MTEITTSYEAREAAEAEFETINPQPEAPAAPVLPRPCLLQVGDNAHAWIDVVHPSGYRPTAHEIRLFVVAKDGNQNVRIEGELEEAEVDALIAECQRVKQAIAVRRAYSAQHAAWTKQVDAWKARKDVYAREKVQEWERSREKRKG